MFVLKEIAGKSIGFIQVEVFKTEHNSNFFYLQANNPQVIHILDYLDKALEKYKPVAVTAGI